MLQRAGDGLVVGLDMAAALQRVSDPSISAEDLVEVLRAAEPGVVRVFGERRERLLEDRRREAAAAPGPSRGRAAAPRRVTRRWRSR